jgi:hypothetical protein
MVVDTGTTEKSVENLKATALHNGKNGMQEFPRFPPGTMFVQEEEDEGEWRSVLDLIRPK